MTDDNFEIHIFDGESLKPLQPPPEDVPLPEPDQPATETDEDEFVTRTVEPSVDLQRVVLSPPRPLPQQPRPARRKHQPAAPRVWLSTLKTIVVVGAAAILISTIFSLWTRPTFFSDEFRAGLNQVQATQRLINIQPSAIPTNVQEVRVGVVAGHSGQPQDDTFSMDPGAVCDDGLTELEINEAVARRVVVALQQEGYSVELLNEFDPVLQDYRANALVSIHTNDCQDYGDAGTGYNVAAASSRQTTRGDDERLRDCIIAQYGATTGLPRHEGITVDMTEYHTFAEVSPDTPTAIIEIGFMRNNRAILTQNPDLIAQGVTNGVLCFLQPGTSAPAVSAGQ